MGAASYTRNFFAGGARASGKILGGRRLNRRDFLKVGGAGLAGMAMLGVAAPAFGQSAGGEMVSASELGISPKNDGITNRENLVRAIRYSKRRVSFPPGDYLMDNSKAEPHRGLNGNFHINIDGFEGELVMEEGARFVFTDHERRGFVFHGGKGAKFRGLSTAFEEQPKERIIPEECVALHYMEEPLVENARIEGSPSVGIVLWHCVRPTVRATEIRNTMADGLHIANCQDARVDDLTTDNTGDDGLAFVNYGEDRAYTGGYATNITVTNSVSRGIISGGQSDVTVDGFFVENTVCAGIQCFYDEVYNTRIPSNVVFRNGLIRNAGRKVSDINHGGQKYGVCFNGVESLTLENIKVYSPKTRGVSGEQIGYAAAAPSLVRISDVEVHDAPETGFNLVGGSAASRKVGGTYELINLSTTNTGSIGLYVAYSDSVSYDNVSLLNCSMTDESGHKRRAFLSESNKLMDGGEIKVADDQTSPTGYKIVSYKDSAGDLGTIHDGIVNGELEIENHSGLDARIAPGEPSEETPPSEEPPPKPGTNPVETGKRRKQTRRSRTRRLQQRKNPGKRQ